MADRLRLAACRRYWGCSPILAELHVPTLRGEAPLRIAGCESIAAFGVVVLCEQQQSRVTDDRTARLERDRPFAEAACLLVLLELLDQTLRVGTLVMQETAYIRSQPVPARSRHRCRRRVLPAQQGARCGAPDAAARVDAGAPASDDVRSGATWLDYYR
jgi:hypothetical protein